MHLITVKVLTQFLLPGQGQKVGDTTYFPTDLTPDIVARFITTTHPGKAWTRNAETQNKCCYTVSLSTDDDGMLNDLAYSEGVSLSNCCEGGQIYVPKGSSAMQMSVPFSELNKSVRVIVDPDKKEDRFVVGNGMDYLEIDPGKYLILENAVPSNNSVL